MSCFKSVCGQCCPNLFNKYKHADESREYIGNPLTELSEYISRDKDPASPAILSVESIDVCIAENGLAHRTNRFARMKRGARGGQRLIVRRGEPFELRLKLNRKFDVARDSMSFLFRLDGDDKASLGHGTLIGVKLKFDPDDLGAPNEWGSCIEAIDRDILTVLIKPAATASIGEWRMDVDTQVADAPGMRSFKNPETFYVLLNPWCPQDQVFMPDETDLQEYILTDTTLIWRGSYNRMRPSVWKLGQFDEDVLDCALLLIAKIANVAPSFRGDPVKLSRALGAVVNSPDDNGAVVGNWSENFSGGTPPSRWVGSAAILQEFYKKQKSVKFGQCWVFAGVLGTIARAIGLPSRIITNYSSAHDSEASLTIDYFVDRNGRAMEELMSDSIWNYHVWNEVWMERPDLGMAEGGYGGWQAVDATPQEKSDGLYRCGPAPVRAVKLGEVMRPYDCNFLFAEVNADRVYWRYDGPSQPLKLLRRDTLSIGQLISTKMVGKWERQDVTSTYKFAEQSRDERDTMEKALRLADSALTRYYLNEDFNDVKFEFELLDDIKIGETFNVILTIQNRSSEVPHTVTGSLNVKTVEYTNRKSDPFKAQDFNVTIEPNTKQCIKLQVTFDDYFTHLFDEAAFNISCMATVKDTEYEYFAQDDFRVRKPDIKFTFNGDLVAGREIEVTVRLSNSLPVPLKKGLFEIDGSDQAHRIVLKVPLILVGRSATATFKYTPAFAGRASLIAKFTSKELTDVDGFVTFEVEPRPEDVIFKPVEHRFISRTDVLL